MDEIVQTRNPRTNRYIKINKTKGLIVGHKKSTGPYKGIDIAVMGRMDFLPIAMSSAVSNIDGLIMSLDKLSKATRIAVKTLTDLKDSKDDLRKTYK